MNIFNKKNSKYILFVILVLIVAMSLPGNFIHAANKITDTNSNGSTIARFLSWIALGLAQFFGFLLTFVVKAVLKLFTMSKLNEVAGVEVGWIAVRDICNMFFVLALLVIAFTTILRLENYSMKKWLPKLIIMAILINFSKTICFLLIDFSQVIMLTFGNAFAAANDSSFINLLGLQYVLQLRDLGGYTLESWNLLYAILLADVVLVFILIIMIMFVVILLGRLVMFWILTILSPLAFFASALPWGQKYSSQWWSEFSRYLIIGPVLAFFTWLALTILSSSGQLLNELNLAMNTSGTADVKAKAISAAVSEIGSWNNLLVYFIGTALLIGALKISQQIGAMGAGVGMNMANNLRNRGANLARRTATAPLRVGRAAAIGTVGAGATIMAQGGDGSIRGRFRNMLGRVGGSRIPFVGNAASRTLTGLQGRQRAQEEQAKNYVRNINDTRILQRLANQRGFSPWRAAVRDAAAQKAPSQVRRANRQAVFNRMTREQLQGLSESEWRRLGAQHRAGQINLDNNVHANDFIQTNRVVRGAVNAGITDAGGAAQYFGLDRQGNAYTAPGGQNPGTPGPIPPDPTNDNAYRKGTDGENTRGAGNLSVNKFGRGKSNELMVDFDDLGLNELKENIGDKFEDIKGVDIVDPEKIKKVSERMVQILDDKINKALKATPNMKKGDMLRIQNLENAREQFKNPQNIKNLSLTNSSYRGFKKLSDVKETVIHERIHGFGQRDEQETERLTQEALNTRKYSEVKGKTEASIKRRPVDEVVRMENEDYGTNNQANNAAVKDKKVKQNVEQIVKMSESAGPATNHGINDLSYALSRLYKAITGQTSSIGKLGKNLAELAGGADSKSTPLEVEVIAQKVIEKAKQENA